MFPDMAIYFRKRLSFFGIKLKTALFFVYITCVHGFIMSTILALDLETLLSWHDYLLLLSKTFNFFHDRNYITFYQVLLAIVKS